MQSEISITGYLRFSFLGRNDTALFRANKDDLDTLAKKLFDPTRLENRFHFFERLVVPSIRSQTDKKFQIFVLASEELPELYKNRLEKAVADLPQVDVRYYPRVAVARAVRPLVREIVQSEMRNTVHFRLDDDDALPSHFIRCLKDNAAQLPSETIITFPRGFVAFKHKGHPYILPLNSPYHAMGWARINGPSDQRHPFGFAHYAASKRFRSFVDPVPVGYCRIVHETADTFFNSQKIERRNAQRATALRDSKDWKQVKGEIDAVFPAIGEDGLLASLRELSEL